MNFLKSFAVTMVAVAGALGLAGCQPSSPGTPNGASLTSIIATPNPTVVDVGGVQPLVVRATYSDGSTRDVNFDSQFSSSASGVATVNAQGVVTGIAPGTARITATHTPSGKTATVDVTVRALRVVSIAVVPASVSVSIGGTQALSVVGTYNDGTTGNVTATSQFVSSATNIATVTPGGVVTGIAAGDASITVTETGSGLQAAPVPVTVTTAPQEFRTITFDDPAVTYTLTGFGGAEDSTVVTDPTGGPNKVAKVVKSGTAELWAGTTVSTQPNNTAGTIPFTATSKTMTVRVYSPRAGIPVRLKVEDAADPTHSVETEATTTTANAWETLTFNFANPVSGTQPLNLAYTYNRVSIFFDFGTTGAAGGGGTFYFDDVAFVVSFATITFDDPAVTYTLTGFGGAEDATVVTDPTGGTNKVAKVVKSPTAELWAGTTVSTQPNNTAGTIPFTASSKSMTVRVYSPRAGIPVRLKVEDAADPTHSVETEATTTTADAWETLTFNFANQAPGTQPLNLAYTYNRVSIFFDFGTTGAAGGGGTFYFDDVAFGSGPAGTLVFASGYASNNRTVEGGEWGFYSGNFANYANTFTGGGFVDAGVAVADSYIYLVVTTSAPTTDGYMGIFTAAPGSTIAAPNAGVTLNGQTTLDIELAMGAEWFAQSGNKQLTVLLIGSQVYSDGGGGQCRILVRTGLTPTTSDMLAYAIPLNTMELAQGCNGGGFTSGVTTLAEALAHPIGEIHVQAVFPNLNTSVLAGPEYPTGFTRGAVWFQ
ncbi:MAG: Ig-like domain-containing protein [Steroidobacteraceae bacterium]